MYHKIKFNRILLFALSAILIGGAVSLSKSTTAQSMQRLFTTQQQRAELDRLRTAANRPELLEEKNEALIVLAEVPVLEEQESADEVYALQGIVLRSDSRYTVWLNNVAVDQQDLPENMELLAPYSQGRLRIRNLQTGESFDVLPGQVLNLTTGQLLESYQVSPPTESDDQAESGTIATASPAAASENTPGVDELVGGEQLLEQPQSDQETIQ